MAELIIKAAEPGSISFNFEELKTELTEKAAIYETMVFTDQELQLAKQTRADLNRVMKALNDERIKREKEFMKPFNDFKAQIKELIAIIEKASANIDKQVKEFEEQKKKEKLEAIENHYDNDVTHPAWLQCSDIFNTKWLNASVSMETVKKELAEKVSKIETEIGIITDLPEYSFEALDYYKRTLDLGGAIAETKRLADLAKRKAAEEEAKRKAAEEEAKKILAEKVRGQETASEPEIEAYKERLENDKAALEKGKDEGVKRWWVNIRACVTLAQANEIKAYFAENDIEYTAQTERN